MCPEVEIPTIVVKLIMQPLSPTIAQVRYKEGNGVSDAKEQVDVGNPSMQSVQLLVADARKQSDKVVLASQSKH